MTPAELARIHASAFLTERGWAAPEFSDLLDQPYTSLIAQSGGFALVRTLAGESELLTLAVEPALQRQGVAMNLLSKWLNDIAATTDTAFLEVAADNHAAIALYQKLSFTQTGLRKAYYARTDGPAADAIVMAHALS